MAVCWLKEGRPLPGGNVWKGLVTVCCAARLPPVLGCLALLLAPLNWASNWAKSGNWENGTEGRGREGRRTGAWLVLPGWEAFTGGKERSWKNGLNLLPAIGLVGRV